MSQPWVTPGGARRTWTELALAVQSEDYIRQATRIGNDLSQFARGANMHASAG